MNVIFSARNCDFLVSYKWRFFLNVRTNKAGYTAIQSRAVGQEHCCENRFIFVFKKRPILVVFVSVCLSYSPSFWPCFYQTVRQRQPLRLTVWLRPSPSRCLHCLTALSASFFVVLTLYLSICLSVSDSLSLFRFWLYLFICNNS